MYPEETASHARGGSSDIQFRGLRDGTLNLILRNRFQYEIEGFAPDLKSEFHEQIQQLKKEKQERDLKRGKNEKVCK